MIPFLLALAALLPPQEAVAAPLESQLDRVTVYPNHALVERVLQVEGTAAGVVQFEISPLPILADTGSFQVRVEEGAVEVGALGMRARNGQMPATSSHDELRQQLDLLRDRRRRLDAVKAGIDARQSALDALVQSAALLQSPLEEDQLDQLLAYVDTRARRVDQERADYEGQVAELEEQIQELNRQLSASTFQPRPYKSLDLDIEFLRPGIARLRLSYLVPNASWQPTYDVRVAPDLTGVAVSLVAQVEQSTGEDWSEVELLLSTSMPSVGLTPPAHPTRLFTLPFAGAPDLEGLAALAYEGPDGAGPNPASARRPAQSATVSAQYPVPERRSVIHGGNPERIVLRRLPLRVQPERYLVPSVSEQAFLRAEVLYSGTEPLLAGSARVYLGPDYLGEADFPVLQQGESTMLNLGVDPHLTVHHERITDRREEPSLLGSTAHIVRVFRAEMRLSPASQAVTVVVEEALPMSRDERIRIKAVQLSPNVLDDDESRKLREEKGILRWRLDLAPGASQRIVWGYDAAFDEDLEPILIER